MNLLQDHTEVVDKSTNSEQGNNIAETFTTEINGRLRKKKSVSSCDSFDVNREERFVFVIVMILICIDLNYMYLISMINKSNHALS